MDFMALATRDKIETVMRTKSHELVQKIRELSEQVLHKLDEETALRQLTDAALEFANNQQDLIVLSEISPSPTDNAHFLNNAARDTIDELTNFTKRFREDSCLLSYEEMINIQARRDRTVGFLNRFPAWMKETRIFYSLHSIF